MRRVAVSIICVQFCLLSGCGPGGGKVVELALGLLRWQERSEKSDAAHAGGKAAEPGAENPVAYVAQRIALLDAKEVETQRARHENATEALKYKREADTRAMAHQLHERKLVELKDAYKSSLSAPERPVRISGVAMGPAELKAKILSTHAQEADFDEKLAAYERIAKKYEARVIRCDQMLAQITRQRMEMEEKRKLLKVMDDQKQVEKLTRDVDELYNQTMSFDTSKALDIDVDDLILLEANTPETEVEFERIMAE